MPASLYASLSMCVCGWHVLCAAKGPSLEKFSTCHLFRHQLNLKSNQTGCCLCLHSARLSLYISSGCLLLSPHLRISFSLLPPLACVPTCPILSLFLMLFICPSSACIFLQHVACPSFSCSPASSSSFASAFSNNSCCSCVGRRADDEGSTWPSSLSSRVRHF